MTAIQKELAVLEKKMKKNPTSDNIKHMKRIKAMATTPEDQAAIEDFVTRQLDIIEEEVKEMEQEIQHLNALITGSHPAHI